MTLDGFVAGVNGQLDWMLMEVDLKQQEYLKGLTQSIDTIILGRKMATEAIPHWEKVAKDPHQDAEHEFARTFVKTPKVVFTESVTAIDGANIRIETGDLKTAVTQLKSGAGKDIIVYGGARFAASLLEHDLVDELNLFVHPTTLGKGLTIFKNQTKLALVASECYSNGIVLLKYQPVV